MLDFEKNITKLVISRKKKKYNKKTDYIAYIRINISIYKKNSHN